MNSSYALVRNSVGLFDFSDRGKFHIAGEDSLFFVNRMTTGNVEKMYEGNVINSLLLKNDGTILGIVWILKKENEYIMITEPEKREIIYKWLNQNSQELNLSLSDKSDELAYISLIGPNAMELTRTIAGDDIIGIPFPGFEHISHMNLIVCRFGNTGEYEYGFLLPAEDKYRFIEMLMETGTMFEIGKCDSEVLSTLMMEMKSINQKYDLLEDTTPLQAGLHWMIDFRKKDFIGKDSLVSEKKSISVKLLLFIMDEGEPIPIGTKLYIGEEECGMIVNIRFSPTIGNEIGLAYIQERVGWVGIEFEARPDTGILRKLQTVSAPLIYTKSAIDMAS